jgi:MYXO-CTERM domain-containing protein
MLGAMMRLARSSGRWTALLVSSLSVCTLARPALANGRYPAAGQIVLSPRDPSTLLVRATYGILLSSNAGKSWEWVCEPAVGYNSVEDPMMAFTADGTILAGMLEGLGIGSPNACQWWFAPGGLLGKYVIDVDVDKVDPTRGVVIVSNSVATDDAGGYVYLTQLWQTADSGATWAQAGADLPAQFLGLTVDTAPSNPQRVYVSGRVGAPDYTGVMQRSDDRGATWVALPIPGTDSMHLPHIGAVDPHDPDIVYVRIIADPSDTLLITKDGGMTWTTLYPAVGKLTGFALSPDGATVAIGGAKDGVLTAPTSTLELKQASSVGALCLTWAAAGLYACADEFVDHFTAGLSTDQGKTFEPLLHLGGLCGPLTCAPDSGVTSMCSALWPATVMNIDNLGCDGGTGSASSSASSSGGVHGPSKGCSCAVPEGAGGGAALALALAGVAVAMKRRRRR